MLKLKDFLKDYSEVTTRDNEAIAMVCADDEDIIFVINQKKYENDKKYDGERFNPFFLKFDNTFVLGFYVKSLNKFYKAESLDSVILEIEDKVSKRVRDIINDDEKVLYDKVKSLNTRPLELYIKDYESILLKNNSLDNEAKEIVVNGKEVKISDYSTYKLVGGAPRNIYTIIDFVKDEDKTIKTLANSFIEEKGEVMLCKIIKNRELIDIIENLKEDKQIKSLIKINKILSNDSYKTLDIKYKRGGNELDFKIKNGEKINKNDDSLPISIISDKKVKPVFAELFKEWGYSCANKIYCESIEEITYRNKVLYKKES